MFATVPVTAAVDGYPCRGKGAVTLERFTPPRRYKKPLVQMTRVAIFAKSAIWNFANASQQFASETKKMLSQF